MQSIMPSLKMASAGLPTELMLKDPNIDILLVICAVPTFAGMTQTEHAGEESQMGTVPARIPMEYRSDVERAVVISKEEGCREVYVFGSVAVGDTAPRSDLDIAVRGCPPERFYRLLGRLMDELMHTVDQPLETVIQHG